MNKKPHANLSVEKNSRTKKSWYLKTALILSTLFLFLSCDPDGDEKEEKLAKLATPQSLLLSRPNTPAEGTTAVIFSWAPVLGATGYQIQQRQGSGAWADITPSPALTGSSTRTTISALTADTSYSFRIRALKTGRDSDYSAALSLSTLAADAAALSNTPLSNLKASAPKEIAKQSTGVDLSWTALVDDKVWGYEIQYHTKDNAWTEAAVKMKALADKGTASLSINDLTADTKFYFRIRAVAPLSDSATAPGPWASAAMLYPADKVALQALIDARISTNPSPDLSDIYTGKITDMSDLFRGKATFNGDIGSWNTGAVTNMESMFRVANIFNQNISGWNTSAVKDMSSMFNGASKFNQDISAWKTSAVTKMVAMFSSASEFNQDLSAWKTSAVKNMGTMFAGASKFNQDISNWKTGAVTDMSYMFFNASKFNQDISSWDVSLVTNYAEMFTDASAMTSEHKPPRFR